VQFGSVSGNFYLHEAYLRWPGIEYVGNVTFGYFGVPQMLENIYPFGSLVFMEAASPTLAFSPGNRMGLQVDRTYADARVFAAFGIFSVGADPGLNFGDATQSLLRPTARVTGLPVLDDKGRYGHRLLHVGGSVSYVIANGPEIEYRARPETFLAPYVVNTGVLKASHAYVAGTEAIYIDGPLTVQGEYEWTRVDGDIARYRFDGYYASATWFLTGEERPYDKASGSIGLIQPRKEFSWAHKTWGAWEVGLRYSRLNLNSGPIRGGDMDIGMLGLNWYWDRYLRWQFNYGYAKIDEGPSPGRLHIFQARLQMMY
jgi:phosphate-selective porin OprO/OprP